jgi:hypothetical protein
MNEMLIARGQQPITDSLPMNDHDGTDAHEH